MADVVCTTYNMVWPIYNFYIEKVNFYSLHIFLDFMGTSSQNCDFFCCVHMIFRIFDNIPQENIFITLMAITIKQPNQLVLSIAAFPTRSCEYPQRGAEIGTHSEVHNSESSARSPTTLSLDNALYFYNFSCGLNRCCLFIELCCD